MLTKHPDVSLTRVREKAEAATELMAVRIDPKDYREKEEPQKKLEPSNILLSLASEWIELKKTWNRPATPPSLGEQWQPGNGQTPVTSA